MTGDRVLSYAQARGVAASLMEAMGTPAPAAGMVADSLAGANLRGHDSHGLLRLPWYRQFITDGHAIPDAQPVVVHRSAAAAVVDGRHGWGQLAGRLAVETAAELARAHGVAVVTARNCNHVGRLGEFAETLAEQGLVSILWCNADPAVAPFGGRQRMLGTDPFAAGIPAGAGSPAIIVDFATAAVAEGKLRLDRLAKRPVQAGVIQDAEGRPSTDPEDFYRGGALLPFGLHKGFGLAVIIELLGGALSGNHVGFLPSYQWGNGLVMIAIAPNHLVDRSSFLDEIATASEMLRASPPAPGVDRVRLPGDVESETMAQRERDGIPISGAAWQQLVELAEELEVVLPG
ncbi:MAG: Ldh family oxidoreductase [Blastococcus sp.]|jgi:uncharacterized oxidoreductase|nr:Ldh family oxidoreductase [Blastococcus sp.]